MWYDYFAYFYDRALEDLYRQPRRKAVAALEVSPGNLVLDVACGTGQNFPFLLESIGDGSIVGVDLSTGMLKQASRRVQRCEAQNVILYQEDIHEFGRETLKELTGRAEVDGVICSLGMTVIPNWDQAVSHCLSLLKEGGRMVLFDVYAPVRTWHTWLGEIVARSDVSREFWLSLERNTTSFELTQLSVSTRAYGGELYIASGVKPLGRLTS